MDIPSIPLLPIELPTPEEMYKICRPKYDLVAPYMIDKWPKSVRDLSFPTTLVRVHAEEMRNLFEYNRPDWKRIATTLAVRLDRLMDWSSYFIRLNSRSPKDASDNLITCSGRQAVSWISSSERCLDDVVVAYHSKAPVYIALREARHLFKDAEFRCFAKDGEVLGVSRYFYNVEPEFIPEPGYVLDAAKAFYHRHLAQFYPNVVFDIYSPGNDQEVLIEINPYGLSDPCSFGNYGEVEKGGERLNTLKSYQQ